MSRYSNNPSTMFASGPGALARALLVLTCLAATLLATARADEDTHRYVAGEALTLWTNKVGPYNNPQETFNYYTLPFCKAVSAFPSPPSSRHLLGHGLEEGLFGTK